MRRLLQIILLTALAGTLPAPAQTDTLPTVAVGWTHPGPLLPDSSNFVTASLLTATPSKPLYSQLGHVFLRLECPVHNLDYCFSFEEEEGMGGLFRFFIGKTDAHLVAVHTEQYLAAMKDDGRGVKQHTLGLTTREKQELWRLLDEDFVEPEMRKFNFLQNNCASVSLRAIENATTNDRIDFNDWPEPFKLVNGDGVRYITRNAPWLQFWSITFIGTEADIIWNQEQRICPELLPEVLKKASLVSIDGMRHPMVTEEKELISPFFIYQPTKITPGIVFGVFFIVVLLITLIQIKWSLEIMGRIVDVTLMVLATVIGVLLIYTSFVSSLFGTHWNWYLIPLNPLPIIIWFVWHKRKGFHKIYLFYTGILVLFIAATPFIGQLDIEHQFITLCMVVRCAYAFFKK